MKQRPANPSGWKVTSNFKTGCPLMPSRQPRPPGSDSPHLPHRRRRRMGRADMRKPIKAQLLCASVSPFIQ